MDFSDRITPKLAYYLRQQSKVRPEHLISSFSPSIVPAILFLCHLWAFCRGWARNSAGIVPHTLNYYFGASARLQVTAISARFH